MKCLLLAPCGRNREGRFRSASDPLQKTSDSDGAGFVLRLLRHVKKNAGETMVPPAVAGNN